MAQSHGADRVRPLRDPSFFAFLALGFALVGCGWLCGLRADRAAAVAVAPAGPPAFVAQTGTQLQSVTYNLGR